MDRNYPGPCSSCCDDSCPESMWSQVSRAASKSKCGIFVAGATPDQDKWYLSSARTYSFTDGCSGSQSAGESPGSTSESHSSCSSSVSFRIVSTIDKMTCEGTCSGSGSGSLEVHDDDADYFPSGGLNNSVSTDTAIEQTLTNCDPITWDVTNTGSGENEACNEEGECTGGTTGPTTETYTSTATAGVAAGCSCRFSSNDPVTSDVTTYADEYTTSELESDTAAALPAWPDLPAAPSGTLFDIASTELSDTTGTYSIMESQYQLTHDVPPSGYFKVTWNENFYLDSTGTPTSTARVYVWDGVIPPGYNPDDSTTWPKSPVYTCVYPAENGSVNVEDIVYTCAPPTS